MPLALVLRSLLGDRPDEAKRACDRNGQRRVAMGDFREREGVERRRLFDRVAVRSRLDELERPCAAEQRLGKRSRFLGGARGRPGFGGGEPARRVLREGLVLGELEGNHRERRLDSTLANQYRSRERRVHGTREGGGRMESV